jgi:hypothetical protein
MRAHERRTPLLELLGRGLGSERPVAHAVYHRGLLSIRSVSALATQLAARRATTTSPRTAAKAAPPCGRTCGGRMGVAEGLCVWTAGCMSRSGAARAFQTSLLWQLASVCTAAGRCGRHSLVAPCCLRFRRTLVRGMKVAAARRAGAAFHRMRGGWILTRHCTRIRRRPRLADNAKGPWTPLARQCGVDARLGRVRTVRGKTSSCRTHSTAFMCRSSRKHQSSSC